MILHIYISGFSSQNSFRFPFRNPLQKLELSTSQGKKTLLKLFFMDHISFQRPPLPIP